MDFTHILTNPVAQVLLGLMAIGFVVLIVVYSAHYLYLGRKAKKASAAQPADDEQELQPVSVVLVAHNEAAFLRENLVYILEQDYPDFEVVVVDYHISTGEVHDDTQFVLKLCCDNYPNLKVVPIKEDVNHFRGRKFPLSIGIQSAKNDVIVLTDVDCKPASLQWLRQTVQAYRYPRTNILLGYTQLIAEKGLLGSMERYDNLTYSADYLSRAALKHPVTGCGRNLSYRRAFFFSKGSLISHYSIPDGADDIFVNQNATGRNTAVSLHKDAFVTYKAPNKFAQWHQMRRHRCATYNRHSFGQKMAGASGGIALLLFYGAAAALIATGLFPWEIVAGALLLKFVYQIVAFAQLEKGFGEKNLCWLAPIYEIYFFFANTILLLFPLRYKK
jgi:cellulose synthase/poly-beta-1,6-N-acetylglucosamine synthase-like glycosyltransferase